MVKREHTCKRDKSLTINTIQTVTGITGFAINIAMFLQVKYTSALTNTISGTAKVN